MEKGKQMIWLVGFKPCQKYETIFFHHPKLDANRLRTVSLSNPHGECPEKEQTFGMKSKNDSNHQPDINYDEASFATQQGSRVWLQFSSSVPVWQGLTRNSDAPIPDLEIETKPAVWTII